MWFQCKLKIYCDCTEQKDVEVEDNNSLLGETYLDVYSDIIKTDPRPCNLLKELMIKSQWKIVSIVHTTLDDGG